MFTITELAQQIDATYQTPKHILEIQKFVFSILAQKGKAQGFIMCPPGHGKSFLVSKYLPTWYLMTEPDHQVIFATYQTDLAKLWGRECRNLFSEYAPEYVGLELDKDIKRADLWGIKGKKGRMISVGAGGAITGKRAHLMIYDDLISNQEQADSPTERENIWRWFCSDAITRLHPNGKSIFIETLRHPDDITARLKKLESNGGDKWEVLRLPALAEYSDPLGRKEGEALWEGRYTREMLLKTKANLEASGQAHIWECLYQANPRGNPSSTEWNEQQVGDHLFYTELPPSLQLQVLFRIVAIDASAGAQNKLGDKGTILFALVDTNGHIWIEDMVSRPMPVNLVEDYAVQFIHQYNPSAVICESGGFQTKVPWDIVEKCKPKFCPMHAANNRVDKEVRIRMSLTPLLTQRRIHIKHSVPKSLFNEMQGFPSIKHADSLDALELVWQMIEKLQKGKR